MQKKDSTKKSTKKRASEKQAAESPVAPSIIDQLGAALNEVVPFLKDRLDAGDEPMEAAMFVQTALYHRFNRIAPYNFHHRYGYDHNARQIADNIKRMQSRQSVRELLPDHGRLDNVLSDLLSETYRLAQSQSTFCESCEHCLRKRYGADLKQMPNGEGVTENTLDSETWAFAVERFAEYVAHDMGESVIVLVLRHLESLAWAGRPGAVKEAVNVLLDATIQGKTNTGYVRDNYEAEHRQIVARQVERDLKYRAAHARGDDDE